MPDSGGSMCGNAADESSWMPWADVPMAAAMGMTTVGQASTRARITVGEIAKRLSIGPLAVYKLLDKGVIPGIRLGHRWIVTRHAYESWEATCGVRSAAILCQ